LEVVNSVGSTDLKFVKTIEHLLASLFLTKIDNILIEVNGSEIPILDGSIGTFNLLFQNNIFDLDKKPKEFQITNYVEIGNYKLSPSEFLQIYCYIEDPKTREKTLFYWEENSPLLPAKTYGYLQDYYFLKSNNLGLGSCPTNTLILSINKKLKTNGYLLCYHKIIDFIGDIYTTTIPYIKGTFYLHNPNHRINNLVARYILSFSNH